MKSSHILSCLYAFTALLLSCGCSPKVYTDVFRSYPAGSPGAPIVLFDSVQMPPQAEILGEISVRDQDFGRSFSCRTAMDTVASVVLGIGGNGLHLTDPHAPSLLTGSCFRVEGRMLRIPDSLYKTMLSDSLYALYPERTSPSVTTKQRNQRPGSSFFAYAGYAFIVSKTIVPDGATGNPRHGFDFQVGYNYTSKKSWGFGARYARYGSSLEFTVDGRQLKDRIALQYLAPEVTLSTAGTHWMFHAAFGLGYASYSEKIRDFKESIEGIGIHLSLEGEYRLNRNLGIVIQTYEILSLFNDSRIQVEGKLAGIDRVGIAAGLRMHF